MRVIVIILLSEAITDCITTDIYKLFIREKSKLGFIGIFELWSMYNLYTYIIRSLLFAYNQEILKQEYYDNLKQEKCVPRKFN